MELNFVKESKTVQVEISYQEIDFSLLSENITEPPRLLLDWLGACTRDEQEVPIEIRQQIHSPMQEMIESKSKSIWNWQNKTLNFVLIRS